MIHRLSWFIKHRLTRETKLRLAPLLCAPNSLLNPLRYRPWTPFRLSHLSRIGEAASLGPLQREEALMVFALTRVLRPRVIVEFGFFHGDSTFNFLRAADKGTKVFSFDIGDIPAAIAERNFRRFENFRFIRKSQAEFEATDIDGHKIDLVLIDAAHELSLNVATFTRIRASLADNAVILVHDTGTWAKEHFSELNSLFAEFRPAQWLNTREFEHQPEERWFVNWILREHPEFSQIHLHSLNTMRHGITILQRSTMLPTK